MDARRAAALHHGPRRVAGHSVADQASPVSDAVTTSHFRLAGMVCAACAGLIEAALASEHGVVAAEVNYATQRLRVRWQPQLTSVALLVGAVERAGYRAAPDVAEQALALRQREERAALWRLFVAAFCAMQVMMYATPAYVADVGTLSPDLLHLLQWAGWLLTIPVLAFSAGPMFSEAWAGLKRGQVRMDLPVVIGLLVGFVASTGATFAPGGRFGHEVYFDSLTMFVSFLLAGRWLTLRAQHRVTAALEGAVDRLAPEARRVEADGRLTLLPVAELCLGDAVRVFAGEAFPADGPLIDGQTEVDEALLTGESRPVAKRVGDGVLAGSMNLSGPVSLRVQGLGPDTRYESVVTLMREALSQRPTLLRTADRIAVPFLWSVLVLAALAAAVWSVIDPARAVWVAVSVLVVTCPCALSLAAPSALLAAAGALARRGILVQRLDALEALARLDTLFFDKTGTLTEDRLSLQAVHLLPAGGRSGLDESAVLRLAAGLAAHSSHPLARALADAVPPGPGRSDVVWEEVEERPGRGLQARAPNGRQTRLGSRRWVDPAAPEPPGTGTMEGASRVWFGDERGALAAFAFGETLKADAATALDALRLGGLRMALLSGDAPGRVQAIAAALGLADAQGGATPETKLSRIAQEQQAGRCVGMVGDGINDAPVIARADVSFAFAQGAAITQSHADFILLSAAVGGVAEARETARRAMRVLRQNVAWALGYNLVCIPLALLGWFPPWAAGIGMAGSSLVVVLNALRVDRRGQGH